MASALGDVTPQHGVVITTVRLRMRAVHPADLTSIHAMRLNPAVMKYMYASLPMSLESH